MVCAHSVSSKALRIAGGAPPKRPRIAISDMKAKDDDIDVVRVCFEVQFNPEMFMDNMKLRNRDELVAYATKIENRSVEQIAAATVETLDEFVALKDWRLAKPSLL